MMVAPGLVLFSLVAALFVGGTAFIITSSFWFVARTAYQFYAFILLKRVGRPNAKWAAITGMIWLLMGSLFFKFVVIHYFTSVRPLGS